ncbi:tetratricopeptide repeat protein [Stenotrophobium rhamnosiphilum]|uniref:Tetratricopeptide repeat protein n=1 Tax=Stenotrophobium rhamnosiphilum TaxID=2029166 RepID=A0A2T5MJ10_9GAMM|nr:tetratricopeptide repeat protein [Stenotrophobium rhamnosiphilum]PTU32555.1 hypothetical protein CJD38_00025 [Stenotrophobium rhamnosiphilum]
MKNQVRRIGTVALLLQLVVLLMLSPSASAQKLSPELEALRGESYRLFQSARQYDAGLSSLRELHSRTEEAYGQDSSEVARVLSDFGFFYLYYLGDSARAESFYKRSLTLYEKQPQGQQQEYSMCNDLLEIGKFTYSRTEYESAVPLFERALRCMEIDQGKRSWTTFNVLDHLGDAYRILHTHPGMVAKADQLFEYLMPVLESIYGPNDIQVATLLRKQAASYVKRKEWLVAAGMRSQAMAIVETHENQPDPDSKWLKLKANLLQDQVSAHRESNGYVTDMIALEYQARLVAVDEKLYGANGSRTNSDRKFLDDWRSRSFYEPKMRDGGSPWIYDDVDHGECVDVVGVPPTRFNEMAYGLYKLINNCSYAVKLLVCLHTDRADKKPSPDFDRHQDGVPCPGFGWGGTTLKAKETKSERTWYEYRNIKWKVRACREGWDFATEDGEPLPFRSLIDDNYTCRRIRSDDEPSSPRSNTAPSQAAESPRATFECEMEPGDFWRAKGGYEIAGWNPVTGKASCWSDSAGSVRDTSPANGSKRKCGKICTAN